MTNWGLLLVLLALSVVGRVRTAQFQEDLEGPADSEIEGIRDFDLPGPIGNLMAAFTKPTRPEGQVAATTTKLNEESLRDGASDQQLELRRPSDPKRWQPNLNEWVKLIFNPLELTRRICRHFGIPIDKTLQRLGTHMIRSLEPLLYPLVYSVRIVERIFQPDQCRLKFVCSMGHHLEFVREHVLKFSPNFLEGSSHLKALSEGIVGRDCSAMFPDCELKLRRPFSELSNKEESSGFQARQMSPVALIPSSNASAQAASAA